MASTFRIQEKGKPETAVWIEDTDIVISNDGSGDLKFNSTIAEKASVKITSENDRYYMADMTFNQPIFINDQPIPAGSKRPIKHGDQLQIANSIFEIIDPKKALSQLQPTERDTKVNQAVENLWRLKAIGNWLDGQHFRINGKVVLGRDSTCDITIPGSHLSRRHVEFIGTDTTLHMKDLDSANGCYVNGERVKEAQLRDGDEVKFDILTFKVVAPAIKLANDKKKTVLCDVTDISASGKTTLEGQGSKKWVTKPTSIGNTEYDPHDIILAKHIRNKRIIYAMFSLLLVTLIGFVFSM